MGFGRIQEAVAAERGREFTGDEAADGGKCVFVGGLSAENASGDGGGLEAAAGEDYGIF